MALTSSVRYSSSNHEDHFNTGKTGPDGKRPLIHEDSLPHFRQTQKTLKDEPSMTDSGDAAMSPLSNDVAHPDVEEALGLHEGGYRLPHPVWTAEELESVRITHQPPITVRKFSHSAIYLSIPGFLLHRISLRPK